MSADMFAKRNIKQCIHSARQSRIADFTPPPRAQFKVVETQTDVQTQRHIQTYGISWQASDQLSCHYLLIASTAKVARIMTSFLYVLNNVKT